MADLDEYWIEIGKGKTELSEELGYLITRVDY
jgi:hypothetical protein